MPAKISIEYCVPCHFTENAARLAAELLALYEKKVESVTIIPSTVTGDFEVKMDNQLVYSKRTSGRLPNPGEVEELLAARLFGGK
jgi:selenoprotein W-related protein